MAQRLLMEVQICLNFGIVGSNREYGCADVVIKTLSIVSHSVVCYLTNFLL